jgi:hypothetical protein
MGTTHIVRRSLAPPWPTLGNRFAYALIAWLPLASVLLLASVEMIDQVVPFALIVTTLVALLAFPRVAYVAAVATVLALLVGGLFVGGLALTGRLPEPSNIAVFIGGLLAVAYVATAVVAVVGPKTLRPWSRP